MSVLSLHRLRIRNIQCTLRAHGVLATRLAEEVLAWGRVIAGAAVVVVAVVAAPGHCDAVAV